MKRKIGKRTALDVKTYMINIKDFATTPFFNQEILQDRIMQLKVESKPTKIYMCFDCCVRRLAPSRAYTLKAGVHPMWLNPIRDKRLSEMLWYQAEKDAINWVAFASRTKPEPAFDIDAKIESLRPFVYSYNVQPFNTQNYVS